MTQRIAVDELEAGVIAGDRVALSRAITLAESLLPEDLDNAQELIGRLLPRTGASRRVGLTGVPGAGKSSLIESLGMWLTEQEKKVAVLVIDPSSSRSGGSILGDKTRMQELAVNERAYIRPSPSAGVLGGVARRTREAMLLCEAAGYDVTIVESVGVGQSEAELVDLVDTMALLLVPGAGDELQGIKRGIVELADMIIVNKADGDRVPLARQAASDYRQALHLLPPSTPGWTTPVLLSSATERTGLAEVWTAIDEHHAMLASSGELELRRRRQQLSWFDSMIEEGVLAAFQSQPGNAEALEQAKTDVLDESITVPQAVKRVLGRSI